jgi:hypothetical protein
MLVGQYLFSELLNEKVVFNIFWQEQFGYLLDPVSII